MRVVREKEMQKAQKTFLDYRDGGLAKVNPFNFETEILKWLQHYQPHVVITYPVHGGSGHHDHMPCIISSKGFFSAKKTRYNFGNDLPISQL